MKFSGMLLLLIVSTIFNMGHASASTDKLNPITRVVQLLQGTAEKIEQDGKVEQDNYDKYICWGTTVVKEKTASNAAGKDRIESLEAYIDDIESGRVEFSSERTDLEAAIKKLNEEIEEAEDLRDKEHNDFVAAKDEMEKAIAALTEAVKVLDEATSKAKGSLLAMHREVTTFQEGEHTGATMALTQAIQMGKRYLSKGDALFLERLLSGDVPKADWKKLNRKSTFKMKYKARSGKIQDILADMLQTFKDNLADAETKEKNAKESFDTLMASKKDELDSAETALTDQTKESGMRGQAKEDAQQEVDDLKAQIEADTGYIADTEKALADMKGAWKERKKLRTLEIASINKAIAILDSDDARDTMKSSMKSQGYLLLQKSSKSALRQRVSAMLRQASAAAKDPRLASLAMKVLLQQGGHFDEVLKAIDEMVQTLKDEEGSDLEKKEDCEKGRMEQTKEARELSNAIDDASDVITRNKAKIEELKIQIAEKEADNERMAKELKEATRQRADEKSQYEAAKADDEAAAGLIKNAKEVLEGFYKDNGLALAQLSAKAPGAAPPPPPPMPDAPYGGAKGESTGIQAILQMILEDVEADIEKATAAEEAAIKDFDAMKKDTEDSIAANTKAIEDMDGEIADCLKTIEENVSEKQKTKKMLDSVIEQIRTAEPGCDFIGVNFDVRTRNRQMEIDGLLKAKTILEGAANGL